VGSSAHETCHFPVGAGSDGAGTEELLLETPNECFGRALILTGMRIAIRPGEAFDLNFDR
jgi:hypothetical protein